MKLVNNYQIDKSSFGKLYMTYKIVLSLNRNALNCVHSILSFLV